MVNLEKYKNDGWGLSKKCFENILNVLETFKPNSVNVVEFGSGISTQFLVDIISEGNDLKIISFDDNISFATKATHPNLKLHITELIECHDSDFENQFNKKQYNKNFFFKKISKPHTRQRNTFYDVKESQFPNVIDLMIVDGPHGNGRSIAFLHGIERLQSGSYVVVDDYNHYDFIERLEMLFSIELIFESNTGRENQWELGGNYKILKIV